VSGVSVVTVVRGRRAHLERQGWGLRAQTVAPRRWIVVHLGGPAVDDLVGRSGIPATIISMPVADGDPLPLAAARNAGIAELEEDDTVVLLDVDVIPHRQLLARYHEAVELVGGVVAGPVRYLPPGVPVDEAGLAELARHGSPHPARPVPADGELLPEERWELLWTLSLAARAGALRGIGGFDERYVGYGAEDTDFAMRARSAGLRLHWVGGAWGYHQHHESTYRDQVPDVVRNARLFRSIWGWWPMAGWLGELAAAGAVRWDPDGETLERATSDRAAGAAGGFDDTLSREFEASYPATA